MHKGIIGRNQVVASTRDVTQDVEGADLGEQCATWGLGALQVRTTLNLCGQKLFVLCLFTNVYFDLCKQKFFDLCLFTNACAMELKFKT